MIRRWVGATTLLLVATGLPAAADAVPDLLTDTSPPQIGLDPCLGERDRCRLVRAEVYGDLQDGDDLAVLGARIGDQVLGEHVFDDGSGFERYGYFVPYGSDVPRDVDYALSVAVPQGTHQVTFYARDRAGNTSTLATTVLGPIPPGAVRHLTAEQVGRHRVRVSWDLPALHGSCCARYVVRSPGHRDRHATAAPPSFVGEIEYGRVPPGWHRFTVRASTEGGTGPARTVRVKVER